MPECAKARKGSGSIPFLQRSPCCPSTSSWPGVPGSGDASTPPATAPAWRMDALIAASAEAAGATLLTLNRRHFPMLAEVLVPYAKG